MPLRPDMELHDYLQIFLARKWIIVAAYIAVFLCAVVYVARTPKQYVSTTTILTIPEQVPENFVQSTVTLEPEGRLSTIQQVITSRTRLKKVMEDVGLFTKKRNEGLEEEAVNAMRRRIFIEVAEASRRGRVNRSDSESFSIGFLYKDPKLAMLTASRLASLFIEENLKLREKQAVGTSEFLETQLKETKAKLEAQERKINKYKIRYSGSLPEELRFTLSSMDRLQSKDRMISDEIRFSMQRKLTLQTRLSAVERGAQAILHEDGRVEIDTSEGSSTAIEREFNVKRNRLVELSAKYTDQYPDVVRLREEVEELKKILAAMPLSPRSAIDNGKNSSESSTYLPIAGREKEEQRNLKSQILSTEAEINALKRERETIRRKVVALQAKVDQAPLRDQEFITLTRDYENLKGQYNELLKKKMEADISQDLEMRMKGDQYQILDPANLPVEPFLPKKKKIFLIAFLLASAMGFGGAIGFEWKDPTIRGVRDFRHFFDLKVLACIPEIDEEVHVPRQTLRWETILGFILLFLAGVIAIVFFYQETVRTILNM